MAKHIYRVGGFYASGTYHTHLVNASSPKEAMNSVLAVDNRFVRMTEARKLTKAQIAAL